MSTPLIVAGLILVAVGFSIKSRPAPVAEVKAAPKPKSNDKRIVQVATGEFEIEYYFEHPAWHTLGGGMKTLDEAKARLAAIQTRAGDPKVVYPLERQITMNYNPAPFVGNNALRLKPTVPLAIKVMEEAQGHFDAAETYNGKDFAKFYSHVTTATKLEAAAQLIEQAFNRP